MAQIELEKLKVHSIEDYNRLIVTAWERIHESVKNRDLKNTRRYLFWLLDLHKKNVIKY